MGPEILTLIYSLILCLVCTALSVLSSGVSVCSTDGMSIRGGEYSLSNGSNVGSELLYHCPDGYYPYPKRMHRCLGHNRWSPSPSRRGSECRVMTCPDPSVLRNGEVSPVLLQYVVGNQTTYECHDGYAFAGSASRVCKSNGKWSGDTPICDHGSGHCRDPGVPPGAKRNGNMLDIGDRVTYECSLGLMLLGSKERICLEGGDWSGTEPVCYSKHYYDTPEEVSKYFSTSLENRLAISGLDDNTDGQQVQRSIQMRQGGKLHIYIALDNSGSISRDNFTVAKNCVKALINQISFFEVIPRYGILSFASEVNEIVDIFSPYSHSDMVLQNLNNVTYGKLNGTGSNLSRVFKRIHGKMAVFKERNELEDTQQAIIMFTDGNVVVCKTNMGGSAEPTVIRIRNLMEEIHGKDWQKYLDIYVFGVGAEMNEEEINKLVSKKSSEKHFYKLRDDTKLTSLFKMIIDESNSVGLCGLSWDRDGDDSTSSKRQEYPWVVTISVEVGNEHSSCMGALVTPRFVLTAAHCFREKQIDRIKVKVFNQEEEFLLNQNSVPARFMSEWKGQMYEKDVQIKLKEKRESCIKDAEEAEGIKNYKEAVTKNFLCTGGTEDKVEDVACKGDSGGALYLKNQKRRIQVGVISWGVKDLCMGNNIPKPLSTATTRDYHINLFRMQKFLKMHLGEKKYVTNYEPLKFVD
ncbi:complement factor B isoform X4 [Salmo trutta]|uniref:complement factor B isoform X4 n=1 Tax=Salmo trutta TaxID=8032 RepID=UPI0011311E21|nr:complement factor B-like isoform X4 [Salmo trutta]